VCRDRGIEKHYCTGGTLHLQARRTDASLSTLLRPVVQGPLDMSEGMLRGDVPAAYAAFSRTARIYPGSIVAYMVAERARRLNRAQEALRVLRVLRVLNLDHAELRGWRDNWREMGCALHMTGDYSAVLAMTHLVGQRYPASGDLLAAEVRALAALGRVDSVSAVLPMVDVRPGALPSLVGAMYLLAAKEFVVRGDAACADQCARWAVVLYQATATQVRLGGRLRALRLVGQHDAALRAVLPFNDTISAHRSSLADLGLSQAADGSGGWRGVAPPSDVCAPFPRAKNVSGVAGQSPVEAIRMTGV